MPNVTNPSMTAFFQAHREQPCIKALMSLRQQEIESHQSAECLVIYEQAIAFIEQQLWADASDKAPLLAYQQCFRWMEDYLALQEKENRHDFILVIPVADRPRHLESCLNSLLRLCELYRYGGISQQCFVKITVLVADDSLTETNIQRHRELTERFRQAGLPSLYFGQQEQRRLVNKWLLKSPAEAARVLGISTEAGFRHKGASAMRNITYLKLCELSQYKKSVLFYFIDSDQEFAINLNSKNGYRERQALNFFYYLDKIFTKSDAQVLTGKVVGDPPVSPAVMAGNFIADVLAFLKRMAQIDAQAACEFHAALDQTADDAAYHDMADLFGFKSVAETFSYSCRLSGQHDHVRCFKDFAHKLKRFFDGEHPTRRTFYQYENVLASIRAARTIYTGNYILSREALAYFIPFAGLKLRMAGPVLGRLIKARIGSRFVSANLPLLHKRTENGGDSAEFRPGVRHTSNAVDLSGEFERQYFGDVMLFTMERLTELGFPRKAIAQLRITEIVAEVERELQQYYLQKQITTLQGLTQLKELVSDKRHWFNVLPELQEARIDISCFIGNIEHNFGPQARAYELIGEGENKQDRLVRIVEAIDFFRHDQAAWDKIIGADN